MVRAPLRGVTLLDGNLGVVKHDCVQVFRKRIRSDVYVVEELHVRQEGPRRVPGPIASHTSPIDIRVSR